MTKNEICMICQDERFVSQLSEALTGTPEDTFVHTLTEKANAHTISNEQYFGELITKFGETKVAQAVLLVMQEKKRIPTFSAEKLDQNARATLSAAKLDQNQPFPQKSLAPPEQAGAAFSQKAEQQVIAAQDKDKLKSDKGASEIKGVCGVCVGRPLLGMLLTLEEWFVGKDREKIEELTQSLEHGTKSAEDVVVELYVAFGQGAVDGINRIIRDINAVLEEAKEKALKQKPELADITWE